MVSRATAVPRGLLAKVECVEPQGNTCGLIYRSLAQMPARGLHSCSVKRICYQTSDYVLWCGTCSYTVASKHAKVDLRIYSIVLCKDYTESTKAVLKDWKTFLDVVFSVHSKFCCTTSGCYCYTLVCSGFY